MTLSRRAFLQAVPAAGAGLTIAFCLPVRADASQEAERAFEPNAYLRIAEDGTVTLWCTRLEMGQGVRTLLPMMIAEELEVDWSAVRVEQAEPGGKFAGVRLHTSGSGSSSGSYQALRTAGAAAREMLSRRPAASTNDSATPGAKTPTCISGCSNTAPTSCTCRVRS